MKYGFASFRDAEKHRRAVTATVDARAYVPPQRMAVAEHLTEWLEGLRLRPQTLSGYRRKIRLQVVPAIGHLPLDELRAMHLNKLYRRECKARRPEMRAWTAEQLRAFLAVNAGDHYLRSGTSQPPPG